jgi:hypothetical protein
MPRKTTPTFVLLNQISLVGSTTAVTFSNIPQGYADLVVTCSIRTNRDASWDPVRIRFNGDSTNGNYSRVALIGNGSSASTYMDSPTEIIVDTAAASALSGSSLIGSFGFEVFDYSAIDKHKSVLTTSNATNVEVRRQAARWASTSTITSITISPYFGTNLMSPSTFFIYGVVA